MIYSYFHGFIYDKPSKFVDILSHNPKPRIRICTETLFRSRSVLSDKVLTKAANSACL